MFTVTLARCLTIFFIIFLMCPKRTRQNVPIGNQQEYYQAIRRSSNTKFPINLPPALTGSRNEFPVIMNKHQSSRFIGGTLPSLNEAGFDLTDEEIKKFKLWDKGVIPYYIDVMSFSDKVLRDKIRWSLDVVSSVTRLNFMELPKPPLDEETRWVFFVNRRGKLGCSDHSIKNFTLTGVQRVVLGYDCINTGGELAEAVLAIAGVPPQHNAPDRDKYITVVEENIMPGKEYLFEKLDDQDWLFHKLEYDFESAGHFSHHKHSVNGRATIKTKVNPKAVIGEQQGLSHNDILKISMLYNYMVMKTKQKTPECNKLFTRGKNFGKVSHKEKKPRPKPGKYLGIESKEEKNGKNSNAENDKASDDNEAVNEDDENATGSKQDNGESNENAISGNDHVGRNNRTPKVNRQTLKQYKDPLTYLSDYQTEDDNFQRSASNRTRYYYNFGNNKGA